MTKEAQTCWLELAVLSRIVPAFPLIALFVQYGVREFGADNALLD